MLPIILIVMLSAHQALGLLEELDGLGERIQNSVMKNLEAQGLLSNQKVGRMPFMRPVDLGLKDLNKNIQSHVYQATRNINCVNDQCKTTSENVQCTNGICDESKTTKNENLQLDGDSLSISQGEGSVVSGLAPAGTICLGGVCIDGEELSQYNHNSQFEHKGIRGFRDANGAITIYRNSHSNNNKLELKDPKFIGGNFSL